MNGPYSINYPAHTDQAEQRRALALAMSIQSVVGFEQPRNGDNYRTAAHSIEEFVERAGVFEKYIREGLAKPSNQD